MDPEDALIEFFQRSQAERPVFVPPPPFVPRVESRSFGESKRTTDTRPESGFIKPPKSTFVPPPLNLEAWREGNESTGEMTNVRLEWDAVPYDNTAYRIGKAETPRPEGDDMVEGHYDIDATIGANDTDHGDSVVEDGTKYYAVRARIGTSLYSPWSNEVFIGPVPSNLTATAGDQQINLNWDDVAGATHYQVYRSSGAGYTLINGSVPFSAYFDGSLTNGTTYYYFVKAVIDGTPTQGSSIASATPVAIPHHFDLTAPNNVNADVIFNVGIVAKNADGSTMLHYAGGGSLSFHSGFQIEYVNFHAISGFGSGQAIANVSARATAAPTGSGTFIVRYSHAGAFGDTGTISVFN